jgi:hypothetical protein
MEIRRLSEGELGIAMDRRQGVMGSSKIDVDWGIVEELAMISSFIGNGWRKLKYQMRKKRR